jgi:hypothetical protein
VDLSTFRTSYARTTTSFFGLRSGWWGSWSDAETKTEESHDLALQPYINWATIMHSDAADFEFGVGTNVNLELKQDLLRNPAYLPNRFAAIEWRATPEASWRYYLSQSDAFVQVSGDLWADFLNSAQDDSSARHQRITAWHAEPRGGIAVGCGRMRDAWPLAQAVRIADVLDEEGVLDHKLSDDELQALAGFISRSWKLFYAHDRAARYYYDSLGVYLTRTRAIDHPLPVYALFRLSDYQEGDFYRPFGWRAYAEIGGSASLDAVTSTEYGLTTHDSLLRGSGSSGVGLEYARLFGLRTIVTGYLAYTLPWPITLRGWYRHIAAAYVQGRYIVTDRLSTGLSALYNSTYAIPYEPGLTRQFGHQGQIRADVRYYLADRFWVSGTAGWSASGGADYVGGKWLPRVADETFSFGADIHWGPDSPYLHL